MTQMHTDDTDDYGKSFLANDGHYEVLQSKIKKQFRSSSVSSVPICVIGVSKQFSVVPQFP
jgi:hypothetical protein